MERARTAAFQARDPTVLAAEGATLAPETAKGDKVRASHEIEEAEKAQDDARDRFHHAEKARRETP